MTITFENSPLIEAIADLRWGAAAEFPAKIVPGQSFHELSINEDFFMHFGAECGALGMQRAERVLPQGFPALPGQVVYRFRSSEAHANNLLQVGTGVFSANALPPYGSWGDFKGFISRGIDALLAAMPEKERDSKFASANLRYLNGFGEEYRGAYSGQDFLRALGFGVERPKELQKVLSEAEQEVVSLSVKSKINNSSSFQVNIYEGVKEGAPALIVELSATVIGVSKDKDELLSVFQKSHELIEKTFIDMTKDFHGIMRAKEA